MLHPNFTAYDGVEHLEGFTSERFAEYCDDKLKSCDKHIDFIRRYCIGPEWSGRVCEVGSGNGKLLFRLEKELLLRSGIGYELSESRCRFAEAFGRYVKSTLVEIYKADFLSASLQAGSVDLVVAVDAVVNLICAVSPTHADAFFKKAFDSLKPGGHLVIELMTCERELNALRALHGQPYRTWKRFSGTDTFSFGLDEVSLDEKATNLVWNKTFIYRGDSRCNETMTNVLKPFRRQDIHKLLSESGFTGSVFNSWKDGDDTDPGEFITLATKC